MKQFYLVILIILIFCSCKKPTLFEQIPSSKSGIKFRNQIVENDSINPIDNAYIYNGGGDFNNDGLPDIYFTGNMVSNKLYINKGNFKFQDVTEEAGVGGLGRWGRGISSRFILVNNKVAQVAIKNSLGKIRVIKF